MRVLVFIGFDHIPQHTFATFREKKAREPFPYYWANLPRCSRFRKLLGAGVFVFLGIIMPEKRRFQ
jgi:hypothetical protein